MIAIAIAVFLDIISAERIAADDDPPVDADEEPVGTSGFIPVRALSVPLGWGAEEAEMNVPEVDKELEDGTVRDRPEAEGDDGGVPCAPPATSDSCAKPTEAGFERKTE